MVAIKLRLIKELKNDIKKISARKKNSPVLFYINSL